MEIAIFKDLTTDDYISELQEASGKYSGLYVDMSNPPERKYVKDKAYDIQQLLKKVDRARIDKSKNFKSQVEKEAADIKERLEIANLPFMSLINEYKEERAKVLADEKRVIALSELADQINSDHEMGLLINKTFEFDKQEELRKQEKQRKILDEEFEAVREEAKIKAVADQESHNEQVAQNKINAENARLADVEHVRGINIAILSVLIDAGFTEHAAKQFVKMAAQNKLPQLTINY